MTNTPDRQRIADTLQAAALAYAGRPDIDTRKALNAALWAALRAGMPSEVVQDICDAAAHMANTGPVSLR